ncbi:uncharacterized protein LOC106059306 [Biomphalaria glabrata]|uniref:Uncharacterized protein LOC106059306 n=1 Tax=Biomphalaria glabrata TaxID=6526 RepID=A0A9W2YHT4_BIOGL|nr:uncharacterized protein LOC106059306 [Biomphalaria glabrata]XP_055862221.1 uncharacterized protein LOC106059306 [Biomphalaria glabrata]
MACASSNIQRLRLLTLFLFCNFLFFIDASASRLYLSEDIEPIVVQPEQDGPLLNQDHNGESQQIMVVSARPEVLPEDEAEEYESEDDRVLANNGAASNTLLPSNSESSYFQTSTISVNVWPKDSLRRMKEKSRRDDVRKKILEGVRFKTLPTISAEQRRNAMDQIFNDHNIFFPRAATPEQRNCYLATCATPKSTSEDMWRDKSQPGLRLNFNLPRLDRKHESDEVRTARLNLFIKPRKDCPCVDEDDKEMSDYLVTIYQFIKPLTTKKRNRVVYKQKILNAVMVPAQGNAWLTIDIKRAVTIWMKKTRKNFGVEVTVQDSYGATINAKEIFVLPDCSNTRTERACRDGTIETLTVMPWTEAMTRDEVVNRNIPYVDVVVTDKALEKSLMDRSRLWSRNLYRSLEE